MIDVSTLDSLQGEVALLIERRGNEGRRRVELYREVKAHSTNVDKAVSFLYKTGIIVKVEGDVPRYVVPNATRFSPAPTLVSPAPTLVSPAPTLVSPAPTLVETSENFAQLTKQEYSTKRTKQTKQTKKDFLISKFVREPDSGCVAGDPSPLETPPVRQPLAECSPNAPTGPLTHVSTRHPSALQGRPAAFGSRFGNPTRPGGQKSSPTEPARSVSTAPSTRGASTIPTGFPPSTAGFFSTK